MKMTKSQFKTLMKECLAELINEGMFDKHLTKIVEGKQGGYKTNAGTGTGMLYGNGNPPSTSSTGNSEINPRLLQAVSNVVSQTPSGRKSMFEAIMMDTALNTLQNQIANGDGFGAAGTLSQETPMSPEVAAHDEAQLHAMSGGNMSRWATAAFGSKKR